MPSEKVIKILRSKSDFTNEEISNMSEREAWAWVYQNKPPATPADNRDQICFTGFRPAEREKLWVIAEGAGMKIVKSVTKKLSFLCTGENPGPSKLEKAKTQEVPILSEEQFFNLLKTGEMPND